MDRHLALMSRPQQLSAFIVSAFGVLALTLAAVGLYGVVSYSVAQRTREIGIRMALGADAPRVVRQLVAGGLKLLVVGGALRLTLAQRLDERLNEMDQRFDRIETNIDRLLQMRIGSTAEPPTAAAPD